MVFLILAGVALGYLSATVTESFGHKYFGHPRQWQRRLYRSFPNYFNIFLKPYFQHLVIHHGKTYRRSFFKQFSSFAEKARVDRWIARKFSNEYSQLVWHERYNLTLKGLSGTLPFAIPFLAGPLLVLATLGHWAFLGSLITAFLPVWYSKHIHPLLHQPDETFAAPTIVRWVMRSWLGRWAFQNHYLHHKYPEFNFNLVPGGDYILGLHKQVAEADKVEMSLAISEFHRLVALESVESSQLAAEGVADDDFEIEKVNYLSYRNPTYKRRFRIQSLRAKAIERSENAEILADLTLARQDFGYRFDDRRHLTFEKWSQRDEFALEAYHRNEKGFVVFRGVEFRTGDVVAVNTECDSDGIYSSLTDRPINFAHLALYVELEKKGRRYPAFLEMSKYGVSSMPLKAVLTDRFSTYAEVFRQCNEPTEIQRCEIRRLALSYLATPYCFDFRQDFKNDQAMTCTKLAYLVLSEAGVDLPLSRSYYHPKTSSNLQLLGIGDSLRECFLMPDDFTRCSRYRIVGLVDNGKHDWLVARALSRRRFQMMWRERTLDVDRFPIRYWFFRWVVREIQRKGRFSSFLLKRVVKLRQENFPSGPLEFLSLALLADKSMVKMTRQIHEELSLLRSKWMLDDWERVSENPEILSIVRAADQSWRSFFEGCNGGESGIFRKSLPPPSRQEETAV